MAAAAVDAMCAICLSDFNKSTRAPTSCPYCLTQICRQCLQTFLLNDINDMPRCVNTDCGQGWTREFLDAEMTRTFRLDTYKSHREKVLADREKARLPATQEDAAAYKAAAEEHERIESECSELKHEIQRLQIQLDMCERRKYRVQQTVNTFGRIKPNETRAAGGAGAAAATATATATAVFVRPCPAPDCKGFLSTSWKCGLCNLWSCPDCHELKGESRENPDHVCDPDKVASAALIEKESKPCPKCGARICKIDGCDQMWCTSCNTGFSWRTGAIANGPIHNPHYFAWLARNGGAAPAAAAAAAGGAGGGAPRCDADLDTRIARALYGVHHYGYHRSSPMLRSAPPENGYLMEVWRIMREIQDYRRRDHENNDEVFRIMRVRYMTGELTEAEWQIALQRAEKDANFSLARNQVQEMFVATVRDVIRQILEPGANRISICWQVQELIDFCNKSFVAIEKRFGRKLAKITISVRLPAAAAEPTT